MQQDFNNYTCVDEKYDEFGPLIELSDEEIAQWQEEKAINRHHLRAFFLWNTTEDNHIKYHHIRYFRTAIPENCVLRIDE